MVIRRLHKKDSFDDLVSLSRAFFSEYEAYHEAFFELDCLRKEDVCGYFSLFVGDDDRAAFVAVEGHRIVGYITLYIKMQPSYWQVKRIGHISGLMVEQEYRRTGIAGQLLAEAKRFFGERGVKYFVVYTAVGNESGAEFYRAQGMESLYTHFLGEVGSES
jgi:ribosomal protein S18 acetylase RimI-like enzyme